MEQLKVALLQLNSTESQEKNLEKGLKYCGMAKELNADIALFPEMWNTGYKFNTEDIEKWGKEGIDKNSKFIKDFIEEAKELEMAIAVTYLEKWPQLPRNTVTIIDRFGKCVLTYAKIHTCDFDVEKHLTPGDDFYVTDLDTKIGNIKIGAMICYDREFPESARILMLKGAEIVLVPNACPIQLNRKNQLGTRAFENMIGIAMSNYAGNQPDCNGHSLAYDGIAYDENSNGERDTLIMEADEAEGIYIANFNIDKLREYRKREVWGNAFRKPNKYGALLSEDINEPFVRKRI